MSTATSLEFPTSDELLAIAGQQDAVFRNLWITWSYYRLNRAMAAVVGEQDLSWCGFATWASKTAGRFIRQEELGPFIERWLDRATRRAGVVPTLVARLVGVHHDAPPAAGAAKASAPVETPFTFSLREFARAAIAQVGDAIGAGNQDVFRHIAPPFAQLLSLWTEHGGVLPNVASQTFLDQLRDRGQQDQGEYLYQAFMATLEAAASTEARRRAQLMLQANALIGCAEQTRVQPFIERSMNAPLEDIFHARLRAHLDARFAAPIAWLLHWLLHPLGRALEREFQDLSTELLMTLELPGQSLRLGLDVPRLPDGRLYPQALDPLDSPQPLDLLTKLHAIDDVGSAARDWVCTPTACGISGCCSDRGSRSASSGARRSARRRSPRFRAASCRQAGCEGGRGVAHGLQPVGDAGGFS